MRSFPLLLISVTACGRIAFDARPAPGTGPGDGSQSATGDAVLTAPDVAPPACTMFGAFAAPQLLSGAVQSATDDFAPTPTLGELDLYFHRCGNQTCDLYRGHRTTATGSFTTADLIVELSGATTNEVTPTLTADALTMVFASDTTGQYHVYLSERVSTADPWGTPKLLGINGTNQDRDPFVTADGLRLIWVSTRVNASIGLLYEATRPDRGSDFGAPIELTALDAGEQISPTMSADGLEVFFVSNRSGSTGWDFYHSTRVTTADAFIAPTIVTELSSAGDDLDGRLSEDGATMYLNYNTNALGGANADLYAAVRGCM